MILDPIEDQQRRKIFLLARDCVGVQFLHQGRRPEQGLDCVGLVLYVAKTLGFSDFNMMDYKKIPKKLAISQYVSLAGFRQKPMDDMRSGDIVILRFGRYLEHTAILSDRGMIHACEKYNKVVEHRLSEEWRSRIISVHAFPILSNNDEGAR